MRHRISNALNTRKRRRAAVVVLATGLLALVGGAYAYFTSTGNGTDQAQVGTSSQFNVAFHDEAGTMYPGAGAFTANFTITNQGSGRQRIQSVTATVKSQNGDITEHGIEHSGCQASWFHPQVTSDPSGTTLKPSGASDGTSADGTVRVTMDDDADTNQDACKDATPDILVTVS